MNTTAAVVIRRNDSVIDTKQMTCSEARSFKSDWDSKPIKGFDDNTCDIEYVYAITVLDKNRNEIKYNKVAPNFMVALDQVTLAYGKENIVSIIPV